MNKIMLKITVVWLIIIVCGTTLLVIQSNKEARQCIEACEALGKEVETRLPRADRLRFSEVAKCRCTE